MTFSEPERTTRPMPQLALVAACLLATAAVRADTIYTGGDILTMHGPQPETVEALVVKDGKILFAGPRAEAQAIAGPDTSTVDLKGKTLLPGFIDTHGHLVYFGKNLVDADLFGCADVADLLARMKKQVERTPPGAWVVGFGYQPRQMKENRTPTIEELDAVAADRPVMIVDSSGHLGVGNSRAFEAAGITADTPNPTGGSFARKADGKSLAGPVEETALNAVRSRRPPFTGELADAVITGAAKLWASYGQTTAMEAGLGLGSDDIQVVVNAIDKSLLPIDLYIAAKDSTVDDSRVGPGAFAPGPLSEPDLWVTHPALWVPVSADGQCCPARGRCNRLASASLAPRSFAVLRFAMCSRESLPPDASDGPDSPPPGGLAANTNFSWRDLMLQNPSPPSLQPLSRPSSLLRGDPTSP
ncbi:MAG: amidohydrolase family protein, partial [Planctomycetes bacterium]|nr:amidohydrolase family protein [Planctomycetota bacterium]